MNEFSVSASNASVKVDLLTKFESNNPVAESAERLSARSPSATQARGESDPSRPIPNGRLVEVNELPAGIGIETETLTNFRGALALARLTQKAL